MSPEALLGPESRPSGGRRGFIGRKGKVLALDITGTGLGQRAGSDLPASRGEYATRSTHGPQGAETGGSPAPSGEPPALAPSVGAIAHPGVGQRVGQSWGAVMSPAVGHTTCRSAYGSGHVSLGGTRQFEWNAGFEYIHILVYDGIRRRQRLFSQVNQGSAFVANSRVLLFVQL